MTDLRPGTSREESADILERAAEVLRTHGWCQGSYHRRATDAYCAVGAMDKAAKELGLSNSSSLAAARDMAVYMRDNSVYDVGELYRGLGIEDVPMRAHDGEVVMWNDGFAESKEQVIDIMLHTAKDLRNKA